MSSLYYRHSLPHSFKAAWITLLAITLLSIKPRFQQNPFYRNQLVSNPKIFVRFFGGSILFSLLPALKRILIPLFLALAFCPTSTKADDGGYLGTVLENGAANYVVQMDDGSLLDVEWDSGYDGWSRGDRVVLTTESGDGYMYNDDVQTEVDVFPYNPADIGD